MQYSMRVFLLGAGEHEAGLLLNMATVLYIIAAFFCAEIKLFLTIMTTVYIVQK